MSHDTSALLTPFAAFRRVSLPFTFFTLLLFTGCRIPAPQNPHWSSHFAFASSVSSTNFSPVGLTNKVDPAWLRPPTESFTLGPGDKLEIELVGETNSLSTTVVGPDGKVYF